MIDGGEMVRYVRGCGVFENGVEDVLGVFGLELVMVEK